MTATASQAADRQAREAAYDALAQRDDGLARLIERHGTPDPFSWGVLDALAGGDPFAELSLHVVSQQISTAAAVTIFGRLRTALDGTVGPERIVAVPDDALRAAGLSGAKARSLRDLAERVLDGRLSFERLAVSDDAAAAAELQAVRGVGPWSAQMFLLHSLRRPDILPAADVGLMRAAQSAFALPRRPTADELAARAEDWRPFRSYAAALLWADAADPTTRSAP